MSLHLARAASELIPIIPEMATQAATLLTLSRYDHSNPAALVRLVTAGAKVRQFPKDVLAGLRTAATEVMDERAASHAGFKRLN